MILFVVFIFGLFVGSFLNVLADRLPKDKSPFKGRSRCDKCKKELVWHDLIPLLSFILLKGKCRYCRFPLSFYYPTIELTTGILFVLVFLFLTKDSIMYQVLSIKYIWELIYCLFIVSSLIVVFFADLKYGIIPDKIVFPAIVVSSFLLLFTSKESWLYFVQPATFEVGLVNHFLSAVGAGLFFLLLFLGTKGRGMGFGDVKLAFLMGLILGFPNIIVSLYVAFLTGAAAGIILIIWRRKRIFGTSIPFGPFLVIGTLVALFWGSDVFHYFLRLSGLS